MYASPEAIRLYAQKVKRPESLVRLVIKDFYPKEAISPDRVEDIDKVTLKFLQAPLTNEQVAEFFQLQKP